MSKSPDCLPLLQKKPHLLMLLPEREASVLKRHCLHRQTLAAIARADGVSTEYASQVHHRGSKRLAMLVVGLLRTVGSGPPAFGLAAGGDWGRDGQALHAAKDERGLPAGLVDVWLRIGEAPQQGADRGLGLDPSQRRPDAEVDAVPE